MFTALSEKNWPVSTVSMEKEVESILTQISEKTLASVQSVHGERGKVYVHINIWGSFGQCP